MNEAPEKAALSRGASAAAEDWRKVRKPIISVFLVWLIYSIGLCLCEPANWRAFAYEPVWRALNYFGLWQSFRVFSIPRNFNLYMEAEIIDRAGIKTTWQYPRPDKSGLIERMEVERWRHMGLDVLAADRNFELWPDFARFVARQAKADGRDPAEIRLVRYYADIPPPEGDPLKPLPEHFNRYTFFKYNVPKQDLL